MANDLIRYDLLVQDALKGVVRKVLADAAREGLLGEHHFYVSFRTDHPGARLSPRLREKYPAEMTVVLQHQFWDLAVSDTGFEVGLSFSGVPERLSVPYEALTGFFDPSVQFGLKFEVPGEAEPAGEAESHGRPARGAASEPQEIPPRKASVPATKASAPKLAARPAAEGGKAPASEKGKKEPKEPKAEPAADNSGAEVVSLDSFRKKS